MEEREEDEEKVEEEEEWDEEKGGGFSVGLWFGEFPVVHFSLLFR